MHDEQGFYVKEVLIRNILGLKDLIPDLFTSVGGNSTSN